AVPRRAAGASAPTAYGVFSTGYGLAWFAGSALMGVLYDWSIPVLVGFSVLMQLAAVAVFLRVRGELAQGRAA
ncbi:MAG: hypothetical protein NUV35_07695, partial [Syntrophomonadaceae bacterium]|nr:hypothetical protein [Syntrophomonadaceae bacterium]